jgi:hypothetical protein
MSNGSHGGQLVEKQLFPLECTFHLPVLGSVALYETSGVSPQRHSKQIHPL